MSEKTRVRISYTVDLDEVPSRISALINESALRLINQGNLLKGIAQSIENQDAINKGVGDGIDNVRVDLSGIDMKLEDCHGLLKSYANARLQILQSAVTDKASPTPSGVEDPPEGE